MPVNTSGGYRSAGCQSSSRSPVGRFVAVADFMISAIAASYCTPVPANSSPMTSACSARSSAAIRTASSQPAEWPTRNKPAPRGLAPRILSIAP